jgi:hypothetical protein
MQFSKELLSPSTKPEDLIIRECRNRRCRARFEVTDPFQSHRLCPECRAPKKCVHGLRTTERCEDCFKRSGSLFIRTM